MPSPDLRLRAVSPLASLRRRLRPRPVVAAELARCELCALSLADEHDHLFEIANRQVSCVCGACAILFSNPAAPKYRRVPRQVQFLADFQFSDLEWQALDLPVQLAFFVYAGADRRVTAAYPSPAGATDALPSREVWIELERQNPALTTFETDVEALLVNRLVPTPEYYRVGVDRCYALVGLVRTHWRGMSGGPAVWKEVARFFADLRERSPSGRPT